MWPDNVAFPFLRSLRVRKVSIGEPACLERESEGLRRETKWRETNLIPGQKKQETLLSTCKDVQTQALPLQYCEYMFTWVDTTYFFLLS
jgi:hypothetical protein